jgi:hypothetical protein
MLKRPALAFVFGKRRYCWARSFVRLAAVTVFTSPLLQADVTGSIFGTVADPSGAVISAAHVTLGNPDTGLSRTTSTDSVGSYQFLAVPVGENYVVEVEATGFQKANQTGVKILVSQNYRADFHLHLGVLGQTVSVQAGEAQVETTNTQLGDVIESPQMTGLPLNGRSYIDLLGLQAGVVPITSTSALRSSLTGLGSAGNFSVNGQRETANSFLVNGADVEEGRNNGATVVPTLDSIQEFRLLTNSFAAEYGRFSGAIVNVVTKSGTNEFHGTVFEFLRNSDLDSRNFFAQTRATLKRNQFGGTFGGPILKNRLFFFTDYQGTRQSQGVTSPQLLVPSLIERGGDFSDTAITGFPALEGVVRGDNVPGNHSMDEVLTQRLGYLVTSGEPYWVSGCNTRMDALAVRCVFPGQVIPQSAWSPVAKATLKFIPNPTQILDGTPFFSTSAEQGTIRDDKWGERIDVVGGRLGLWTMYYDFDDAQVTNPFGGSNLPGFPTTTPSRAQLATLSNTKVFGSTAVNDIHLNFTRLAVSVNQPAAGLGKITDFGFVEGGQGIVPSDPKYEGVPPILLFGAYGISFGLPIQTTGQYNNTYQVADNFSKTVGRHTLKLGGEFQYLQINERNVTQQNGRFNFLGNETGNDFADYLIGAPDLFIQASDQFLDSRTKYGAVYAQDSYKARSNLTINYGLRWEVSQPFYDKKLYTLIWGLQSKVYANAPTGYVVPGDPGVPKTLAPTRYNNFAPRIGVAYSPSVDNGWLGKILGRPGQTSIRAAFGIYYNAIEDRTLFTEAGGAPFGLFWVSPTEVYLEEPYKDRRRGQDPGQRFPWTIPPAGSSVDFSVFQPFSSSQAFKNDNVLPYAEHFNFTVQREIRNSIILSVGYVGTRGHHLLGMYESNPGNPAFCLQVRQILGPAQGCGPDGEDQIYNLGNGQFVYGTRPHSVTSGRYLSQGILDFGGLNDYIASFANSNYNALQVSVSRTVGPLNVLAAYTWSKSLDNDSDTFDEADPYNQAISKSLSTFDMTHNFVVSYVYSLPFQKLTKATDGPLHKILDGWRLVGITRLATGLPVTLTESDDFSLCGCGGADRPNYTGGPINFFDPRSSATHQYFSTNAFSKEDLGVGGNANRRFFHGPGINNTDLGLEKITKITERASIEFRAEFFNVFNHAQFGNPGGNISSPGSFGRVTTARDPRIGQLALKFSF